MISTVPFYRDRKFWTMALDAFITLATFVLTKYYPNYKELFLTVWGSIQPIVVYLIARFTVDEVKVWLAMELYGGKFTSKK